MSAARDVVVRLERVSKRYGGAVALDDVSLEFRAGVAHALAGENGAGKSTLVKLLAGAIAPSSGSIVVTSERGEERFAALTPALARSLGIRVVHQELALFPALSVAENVHFGEEPRRFRFLRDTAAMVARTQELLDGLGVAVDARAPLATLTLGERQAVEIARGLRADARLFVLDEPTAALSEAEATRLHSIVRRLLARGVALLYVSHRLHELFELCEEVTVLRDGRQVHAGPLQSLTRRDLIRAMAGADLGDAEETAPPHHEPDATKRIGAVVLEVERLAAGRAVRDISFQVRAGEVVGLAGLVGAGRSETLRAIAGADRRDGGTVTLRGEPFMPRSTRSAAARGVALLPEDRKTQGVILRRPVDENVTLAVLPQLARAGVVRWPALRARAAELAQRVKLKAPSLSAPMSTLSGGNQQKALFARWLAVGPSVLLLDEPTRGIDVAARQEIYQSLRDLTRDGAALVVASSSLPELLALCDRIVVFREGRVAGVLERAAATAEKVLDLAAR